MVWFNCSHFKTLIRLIQWKCSFLVMKCIELCADKLIFASTASNNPVPHIVRHELFLEYVKRNPCYSASNSEQQKRAVNFRPTTLVKTWHCCHAADVFSDFDSTFLLVRTCNRTNERSFDFSTLGLLSLPLTALWRNSTCSIVDLRKLQWKIFEGTHKFNLPFR